VKGLFARLAFTGFGPSRYRVQPDAPLWSVTGASPRRLRGGIRRECPRLPGVYGMVDAAGELIYVGKAKNLRARLLSYFRPSGDDKARGIVRDARLIGWECAASEFAALLRELELIRRWQPRCNVQGQPRRRRRGYLCIGRSPAPFAFLSARPPGKATAVFGPLPAGQTAREAVRRINDWFQLRDCPQAQEMIFADQQELFPLPLAPGCLRHEIGHCLAPCAALCTQAEYVSQVDRALAFLAGDDPSPLALLEKSMTEAAQAQQFERAAVLRDRLQTLGWLDRHLARLRQAVLHSCVYPVRGTDGGEQWYLIERGRVRAVCTRSAEALPVLQAVFRRPEPADEPLSLEEIDGALLVDGWFRRHPEERARALTPREALAACGDL
jgi:excinuclease ABC subunit C